jgi:hypothetical protein
MSDRSQADRGPVTRFLGDTPLRIAMKLIVLSILVGMVMQFFGWSPQDVLLALRDAVRDVWDMGFDAFDNALGWFLLGAAVVLPVFLISRLLSLRR